MRLVTFLILWSLLFLTQRSHPFIDPGSFWHVTVGERILTDGLPHTDECTFTFHGEHWIAQQWLAECLMALLHRVSGHDSLLVGMATLLAALFTGLTLRFQRAGFRWPLALTLTCGCMFVCSFHFFCRPHLLTLALMGWSFAVLTDIENGRLKSRWLACLIPVCVLWTNLHGGVVAGVATFGLCVLGWGLWARLGWPSPVRSYRSFGLLCLAVLACLLTPVINPYGTDLLRTWWEIIGSPVLKQIVPEHTPMNLARSGDKAVAGFALVYLAALAGVRQRPRVTWLVPLVWLALTIQSIRQGPIFCVLAAIAIAEMLPATVWLRWLRRAGDSLVRPDDQPPPSDVLKVRDVLIPGALIGTLLALQSGGVADGWVRYDPRYVPVGLREELVDYARQRPEGTPILNDSGFGGYLIHTTPRLRVFIDDRCELYTDEFLLDYVRVMEREPEGIEAWAREYGFERALVARGSPADRYLAGAPRWKEEARDRAAVLYSRLTEADSASRTSSSID